MRALGKWSVEHRVTVNLIMVFLIVAGVYTVLKMNREMMPQFNLDMIDIGVTYPGASPEEVEEGICIKIEEQLKSLEDVKVMYSTALEGHGSVFFELKAGTDVDKKVEEIKSELDLIDTFPEEAEDPVVTKIKNNDPAIYVAVYGDVSEQVLKQTAEKIRDDLVEFDEISLASVSGVRDYEISIEISEPDLRQYALSFDQVASAVKSGSMDLPGGRIKTRGGEFLVRAKGKLYTGEEFEQIPVKTLADGTIIRLKDVADVKDAFEDQDLKARFNGKPAAMVIVRRTDTQDNIAISKSVKTYIKANASNQPKGVNLATWFDMSLMIQDRIDLLLKNGLQGILLVFIILALFLNLRLAFWVALGIPISFMGAFIILDYLGATVNMLSLFGFIMTLGILVDDAIIVGENVYSHYSRGKTAKQAIIDSMGQVGGPVIMAVSTTIVAFVPLMNIAGIMGKFIAVMPLTVICILAISLVEALIILPAHLEHALEPSNGRLAWLFDPPFILCPKFLRNDILVISEWLRSHIESALNAFIIKVYQPVLKYCVRNRYFTLSIGVGILIISIGAVAGGHVPFVFFQKADSNWIVAEIVYPMGTPFEKTEASIKQIESGAFALNDHFQDRVINTNSFVVNNFSQVGIIPRRDWKPGVYGGHCGEAWIEIQASKDRPDVSAAEVTAMWRELTGDIPGVESLTFTIIGGGPSGVPIEIQLKGDDLEQLQKAAGELKRELSTYPGTYDIADNFRPGKVEKRMKVKDGARSIGITMADIALQIRQAFYGEEALKVQRGKDDINVMVRYSKKERETESSIDHMRIRTRDGREIPLNQVAEIESRRGYSTIQRVDRKRIITVESDINEDVANASEIVKDLKSGFLNDLVARYPGISYDLEGQAKRTEESIESLVTGFLYISMIIFLLLASQFRSYIQPVIIMTAIPFGLTGAIAGHYIMGIPFTMISIFGIVALSGIVVNDSLILIDFINSRVRKGIKVLDAVIESGQDRFRPVLLTSVTTIAGLFPLLQETSFQAQFLIPMAVSISYGLLAATLLTLIFVPSLYVVIKDFTDLFEPRDIVQTGEAPLQKPSERVQDLASATDRPVLEKS